jgi:CheY-like chemotaxis protein
MTTGKKHCKHSAVMIIDDNEIDCFILEKMLSLSLFAETFSAYTNVSKAISALENICSEKSKAPEFIFLDLDMPVLDGIQFLEKLRSPGMVCLSETSIIVLTNSIDPGDSSKALAYKNVKCCLNKPLKLEDLAEL